MMLSILGYFANKPIVARVVIWIMLFASLACTAFAVPVPVSLQQAIELAEENNPQIKLADSVVRESLLRSRQISSGQLPQVEANYNYTRYGETPPGKVSILGDSENDFYTDLTVRQLIFSGGRLGNQIKASRIQTEIDNVGLEITKRDIRLLIMKVWLSALDAKYSIRILNESQDRMDQQLQIAKLRYSAGLSSELDIIRYETQVISTDGRIQNAEASYRNKLTSLAQAIGITDSLEIISFEIPDLDEYGLLLLAHQAREIDLAQIPEIKADSLRIHKASLDRQIAKSSYYPSISAKLSANLEDNLLIPQNFSWYFGVNLSLPLYTGGRIRAEVDQAVEREYQTRTKYEASKVNRAMQLRTLRENMQNIENNILVTNRVLESAYRALDIAELRYSDGQLSAYEVIDAQNLVSQTRISLFSSQIELRIAQEEYLNAATTESSN